MRWLLILLATLFPFVAHATNDCGIEFALWEQVGPPKPTEMVVSVTPYDSNVAGARMVLCASTDADALGLEFPDPAAPPAGVACGTIDAAWTALSRVDLVVTGLTANTKYNYKIMCDRHDPNPGSLWGSRPMRQFTTLATEDADQDFRWTYEADPHYGTLIHQFDIRCGNSGSWGDQLPQEDIGFISAEAAITEMGRRRRTFHVNVGDFYQTDGGGGSDSEASTGSCERSMVYSPVIATQAWSPAFQHFIPQGTYMAQIPGISARDADGCSAPDSSCLAWSRNIQQVRNDANVKARAKFSIWTIHKLYNSIFSYSPLVFSYGNHDNPKWPARYDSLSGSFQACVGQFTDDQQGAPKVAWEHMAEAFNELNLSPATAGYYQPTAAECETVPASGVPACNTLGHYYRFPAGLAEFWVVNPFEDSGGKGNPTTSTGWDLTNQAPSTPDDWSLGEAQWNWLNRTVAASNAKWKFLMLHHLPGAADTKEPTGANCYWYGRGGAFATKGFYCDVNGNDVDDGAGEKSCNADDNIGDLDADTVDDGYNNAADNRPAGFKAVWGACDAGVQCKSPIAPFTPAIWANRFEDMSGANALGGQQAIQALLEANINDGGVNFMIQGHDHTTIAGQKQESPGGTDIWYITASQPTGDGDGNNWSRFYLYGQWFDYNNDGLPDYRADGDTIWPDPQDIDAGTIRQAGSERRGFFDVAVSSEGVEFDFIQTSVDIFPEAFGTTIMKLMIGEQAIVETDFDGATSADKESVRAATAPTIGIFDCDNTTAPLEGTQDCSYNVTATSATMLLDAGWADTTGIMCNDLLWHPTSDLDIGSDNLFIHWRNDALNDGGAVRINTITNTMTTVSDASAVVNVSGQNFVWTEGTTYMIRHCYTPSSDLANTWIDACDPDDDNCDGADDSNGTATIVPDWGTGAAAFQEADGAAAGVETDGYRLVVNLSNDSIGQLDALGICDHNPNAFKCGDNFE